MTIIILLIAFTWLLYETDYMRVRLLSGAVKCKERCTIPDCYIRLGVKPICGDTWYHLHRDDYKEWRPTMELRVNGTKHTFTPTIEAKGLVKEIIKINTTVHKLNKHWELYPPSHYKLGVAGMLKA